MSGPLQTPNLGIPYTAILIPPNAPYNQNGNDTIGTTTKTAGASRYDFSDPNDSIMACQEDNKETVSDFAFRLIGELVPRDFLNHLLSQGQQSYTLMSNANVNTDAVVVDFGLQHFMICSFHDGDTNNANTNSNAGSSIQQQIKNLPRLNVVLSIAPHKVEDPYSLPIVAAGQTIYTLLRSLRSDHPIVYIKTSDRVIWTLDEHMPARIPKVTRMIGVQHVRSEPVVYATPSTPTRKKAITKSPKKVALPHVSKSTLLLGSKCQFTPSETAELEQAFLHSFDHEEDIPHDDSEPQMPNGPGELLTQLEEQALTNVEQEKETQITTTTTKTRKESEKEPVTVDNANSSKKKKKRKKDKS